MIMRRIFMLHALGKPASKYTLEPQRLRLFENCRKQDLITFDDGYLDNITEGRDFYRRWSAKIMLFLVSGRMGGINDWDTQGVLAGRRILNWSQARELQRDGVNIGSHGFTHRDLRFLDDVALHNEVSGSRKMLEDRLGVKVDTFAYPYGYFNQRVIEAVKEAGYVRAFTTSGSIWAGWGDPYRTRRIEISGLDSEWMLRAKISGLYDLKNIWELPGTVVEKIRRK